MIALISRRLAVKGRPSNSTAQSAKKWRQRVWRRLTDWLTEPIPFPGKWPSNDGRQESYNGNREGSE